ncbi:hypothetical protein OAH12_02850 [Cyclobacteriaceae bacterium]|nr:hypothetical protein [Cyclobacteriaceae bacterium]
MGKVTYPLRQIGYIYAIVMVYLHHHQSHELYTWQYAFLGLLFIYPTIAFVVYKAFDCQKKVGEFTLDLDSFWAGITFCILDFSVVPSFTLFTLISANIISVMGVRSFLKAPFFMAMGILIGWITYGYHFIESELLVINIISYSMIFYTSLFTPIQFIAIFHNAKLNRRK